MKGSIGVWAVVLAVGWAVTILWIIFTTITIEHFYPWALSHISEPGAVATLNRQVDYWNMWPIFLMVGLTVYAIVHSGKTEPTDAYVSI